jgi:hypothetical protein
VGLEFDFVNDLKKLKITNFEKISKFFCKFSSCMSGREFSPIDRPPTIYFFLYNLKHFRFSFSATLKLNIVGLSSEFRLPLSIDKAVYCMSIGASLQMLYCT